MTLAVFVRATCASLCLLVLHPQSANAISPPFVSDQQLAERPAIVVAQWKNGPWKDHSLVEGNVLKEHEVTTEIEVKHVVKGDLQPGTHTIRVGFAIDWSLTEPRVMSRTSTEVLGDAEATVDNLWFLSSTRSRVDSKEHWCLDTYRGVQPLALEPWFAALQTGDITEHIPQLLRSDQEVVSLRTLDAIAGGNPPWPFEPWSFIRPAKAGIPIKSQADRVRALFDESTNQSVRRRAAAAYGHVGGAASIPFFQNRLEDEDPVIRAIALGTLAQGKNPIAADAMTKATQGIDEPRIACVLIERWTTWGDLSIVPGLIEFLQNDGFWLRIGNDWEVPAIKSRIALSKITGHWFPFDVARSARAWETAKELPEAERIAFLARTVPSDPAPWHAALVIEQGRAFIDITNQSQYALTLARQPSDITLTFSRGTSTIVPKRTFELGKQGFVHLEPRDTYRFEIAIRKADQFEWFTAGKSRSLDLAYMSNGNEVGVNAWLGVVSFKVGDR